MEMDDIFSPDVARIFEQIQRNRTGGVQPSDMVAYLLPLVENCQTRYEMEHLILAAANRFHTHPRLIRKELTSHYTRIHKEHADRNTINRNCKICFVIYYPMEDLALEINPQ